MDIAPPPVPPLPPVPAKLPPAPPPAIDGAEGLLHPLQSPPAGAADVWRWPAKSSVPMIVIESVATNTIGFEPIVVTPIIGTVIVCAPTTQSPETVPPVMEMTLSEHPRPASLFTGPDTFGSPEGSS